jgi:chaperonin GroES
MSEEFTSTINTSGIRVLWIRALVKLDKVEEKTQGGIFIPEQVKDKEEELQVKGTLIAVGPNAFDEMGGDPPRPGDRVYVGRYAGSWIYGADGERYRLINGRDIFAVIEQETPAATTYNRPVAASCFGMPNL